MTLCITTSQIPRWVPPVLLRGLTLHRLASSYSTKGRARAHSELKSAKKDRAISPRFPPHYFLLSPIPGPVKEDFFLKLAGISNRLSGADFLILLYSMAQLPSAASCFMM